MHLSLPLMVLSQACLGFALDLRNQAAADAVAVTSTSSHQASTSTSTKLPTSTTKTTTNSTSSTKTSTKSTSKVSTTSSKSSTKASTTSKKSTTTAGSATATPTGKRGLSYNDAALTNLFPNYHNQISFQYNWGQTTVGANPDLEFVPMLWSLASSLTSTWGVNVEAAIASGTKHILGFNEPDLSSQANILPADAAAGWMEYMQPYAGKIKLGGPAISCAGLTWLQEFYGNCTSCHIDFQPVHWYDYAWNIGWFNSYIADAYAIANRSIWVTEFQGWGNDTEQIAFIRDRGAWMDETDWIGGYAYFGVFNESLVNIPNNGDDADATMSDIGNVYNKYVA